MFRDLAALRERPLPDLGPARLTRRGARQLPIDVTDQRSTEPLLPLLQFGVKGRNYYAADRNPPYWRAADGAIRELYARESVCRNLALVNDRLRQAGLRLHVFDAWRPRAVQAYFHDVWLPQELRRRRPHLEGEALSAEVERYWAAPTEDPGRPAPHATGAAIDLTIVWEDGEPLFMGGLFDDATALSNTDHFERPQGEDFSFSAEEAAANRRLLYWVMTEAGFANHPDEWWHYSWGDQMWAALTGAPAAIYGQTAPPA
jgi:D-alanyl-D-alanine dipeptidase